MGGFQKYPIPRYLHVQAWVVNKNWRKNVFHMAAPLALFAFLCYRNVSLSTYTSPAFGYYVDPEVEDTPRLLKLNVN